MKKGKLKLVVKGPFGQVGGRISLKWYNCEKREVKVGCGVKGPFGQVGGRISLKW